AAVDPPPMMVPPRAPEFLPPGKSDPLPAPRPVETPPVWAPAPAGAPAAAPQPELHPAPPELMYPAGALEVNKHGAFGSAPIRLSRDYPSFAGRDVNLAGDDGSLTNRFFVRGEYLLWWVPGFPVPVLGTSNANTALNGYFGEPGTTAILGPGPLLDSTRSGFRIRAGAWLDDGHSCGIDGSFFFLGNLSDTRARTPDQFPLITRPIFAPNTLPGAAAPLGEFGEAVAVPGILNGTLSARSDSRLWGADVNLRKCLVTECNWRAEWFVGYRHLNLRESLTIGENITVVGSGAGRLAISDPVGTRVVVQDRFLTHNYFNGGQIGAYYERRFGRWDVDARGSVALGSTHQVLEISGFQTRARPDGTVMNFRGGLLAAGPNLGKFERDKFSVAPEFTLNAGYWVLPHLRVFAGYNFLLWTNVIRPGDQIDRVVDVSFVPNAPGAPFSGQNRPHPLFAQRDLVVNGVQFGLDWRW
ncbi:MAG: BBP7 family outer membrane beta-barrel protein, partial [Planctomycetes bacterium]|nr:BBP7 family outer membrane beta-barrel protein [Planctomycetota bacterium]